MKKYRFLEIGETVQAGDEIRDMFAMGKPYREIYPDEIGGLISFGREIPPQTNPRRPIPLELENRFLVNLSITVSVEFDCTGLSDEEMSERAALKACNKVLGDPAEYVIPENVDWEQSRLDDDEFQPKYRELEVGEMIQPEDFFRHKNGNWVKVIEVPHRVLEEEKGRFKRRI